MITVAPPHNPPRATLQLPGSKSLSNRYLILNHVLGGAMPPRNLSAATDTQTLAHCIHQLERRASTSFDAGDAGTAFRFLCALLAATPGEWMLDGSERMRERPVSGLVEALRTMGAAIGYQGEGGHAPLRISGRKLHGGTIALDGSVSSQFASAILLVSPLFSGPVAIRLTGEIVSRPYLDMTVTLLREAGMQVECRENFVCTRTIAGLKPPGEFVVESDWTSASYWYSVCALAPGSKFVLKTLHMKSAQGDARLAEIYARLGVHSAFSGGEVTIENEGRRGDYFEYDFNDTPDLAQTLAATCAGLGIAAHLKGLRTLRVKETDRIAALTNELRRFRVTVKAESDELHIEGKAKPPGENEFVRTYSDHRMAMSFAPLSLVVGPVFIENEGVVTKSYPSFWDHLRSAGFRLTLPAV